MEWTGKVNAIILISIICLAGVGIARTVTYYSVTDAKAALGTGTDIEEIGCFVTRITKSGNTIQELDEDWIAQYVFRYTIDGEEKEGNAEGDGAGWFMLATNNEAEAKAAAAPLCDQAKVYAEATHGTITSVRVETLAADNPVLDQKYSPTNREWTNITAAQVEP